MLQFCCSLPALGNAPSLTGSRNRWDCKLPHPCGGRFILSPASKRREEGKEWEPTALPQVPVGKQTLGSHGQQTWTGVSGCGWHRASPRNREPLDISDQTFLEKGNFKFLVASSNRIYLFIHFTLVYSHPQLHSHIGKR